MNDIDLDKELAEIETCARKVNTMLTGLITKLGGRKLDREINANLDRPSPGQVTGQVADTDVLAALSGFKFDGNNLIPCDRKVSAQTWSKLKRVIENNGGRWVTGKNHFAFKTDPKPILEDMLIGGKLANKKKDQQMFYTPLRIAQRVAELADCADYAVLEPSAGEGALADACMRAGAHSVHCVENDPMAVGVLTEKLYDVDTIDFLKIKPTASYRRVVMNPPFTKLAYIKHIEQALKWVMPGGRIVAVIPGTTPNAKLRAVLKGTTWSCNALEPQAFAESGTNVQTAVLVVNI